MGIATRILKLRMGRTLLASSLPFAGRPRNARFEKILEVQIFLRIFTVAPCTYTGDHRQSMGIMGRSWAVSRVFQNYAEIVSNPYIITSAEVMPRIEVDFCVHGHSLL